MRIAEHKQTAADLLGEHAAGAGLGRIEVVPAVERGRGFGERTRDVGHGADRGAHRQRRRADDAVAVHVQRADRAEGERGNRGTGGAVADTGDTNAGGVGQRGGEQSGVAKAEALVVLQLYLFLALKKKQWLMEPSIFH